MPKTINAVAVEIARILIEFTIEEKRKKAASGDESPNQTPKAANIQAGKAARLGKSNTGAGHGQTVGVKTPYREAGL